MVQVNQRMRVSKYFKLDRDQSTLDFVDVPVGADTPVFLDPSRLRSLDSTWASECNSLLQHFFELLLQYIKNGKKESGIYLLEGLNERNEFHLGFSSGRSQGTGFGPKYAQKLWDALNASKAGASGLLKDLEDACLFIEGVGPDRISDATCNIIRGPLIRYTQDMCAYYGIPMTKRVDSGPVWDPVSGRWEDSLVDLPVGPFGKILLVPKLIVRHRLVYDPRQYFDHYLLPEMQAYEKGINSGLVYTLKDGRKRVTKRSLKDEYGADKLAISEQALKHPGSLDRYREEMRRTSSPMSHDGLAEVENVPLPNFDLLLKRVIELPVGIDAAADYENSIEALLSAVFYPSLTAPEKQYKIHDGRKRIDIKYVNNARNGFFAWLSANYPAAHIFVECKNYGKEVGNPEVDQISSRFGPSRGQIGILICREVDKPKVLDARCKDTANDGRGFVITLTDNDLRTIVKNYSESNYGSEYPLLRKKFTNLIM